MSRSILSYCQTKMETQAEESAIQAEMLKTLKEIFEKITTKCGEFASSQLEQQPEGLLYQNSP